MACGMAAALVVGSATHAARPIGLGDLLLGAQGDRDGQRAPAVARYVDETGDMGFVLDRSAPTPLLRYDDSPEIWVLSPQPASHGDVIYKNDVGEPVLRATRLGGMTVFTLAHPGGAPAALVSEAPALRPVATLTPNMLLQRLAQASAHASRAAQRLVVFDAPDVTAQTASLVADAATVTAEAIESMARDPAAARPARPRCQQGGFDAWPQGAGHPRPRGAADHDRADADPRPACARRSPAGPRRAASPWR